MESQGIQINKYISSTGFCSRREADLLVEQGRVTINGKLAKPISRVNDGDRVAVDDEVLKLTKHEPLYIAFNKPKGITSTTDDRDRTSITSYINHNRRIFPIGRLDKDSEGLILLTDDGDIVNKILRADNEHEKEYIVSVDKPVTPEFIKKMAEGVAILDTVTKPCIVKSLGNKKFKIILTQGLNRQIRRMCDALGYKVTDLRRVRIMHIQIGDLPIGKWRKLTALEIEKMNVYVKDSSKTSGRGTRSSYTERRFSDNRTPDSKFKQPPKFHREGGIQAKKESKFIRPFKAGDQVAKELYKDSPVKHTAGKKNFKPKDKLALKKEKHQRSLENVEKKAKTSSRKNFHAKPIKKRTGK